MVGVIAAAIRPTVLGRVGRAMATREATARRDIGIAGTEYLAALEEINAQQVVKKMVFVAENGLGQASEMDLTARGRTRQPPVGPA